MDAATRKPIWLIPSLGLTQIVGWGSMFYAYGVLMQPMQMELQTSKPVIVGAYSLALLGGGYPGAIIALAGIATLGAVLFFYATARLLSKAIPSPTRTPS